MKQFCPNGQRRQPVSFFDVRSCKVLGIIVKVLGIVVLTISLSSCSTFGLLFDRLPLITRWQMDRMFDLRDEQEEMIEAGSEALVLWMRETGFPALIIRLEQAQTLWQQSRHAEAATVFEDSLETSMNELLVAARPHLLPFFMSLDEHNAAHYRAYNQDRQAEWFASLESEQDKQDDRLERMEDWFGNLNRAQQAQVRTQIKLVENEYAIRLANNEQWKERMLDAALQRDSAALHHWLGDPSMWWTDDYLTLRANNLAQRHRMIQSVLETMTPTQSAHVNEQIEDWIESLNSVL